MTDKSNHDRPAGLGFQDADALHRELSGATNSRDQFARLADMARSAEKLAGMGSWRIELSTRRVVWSAGMYDLFGLQPDTADLDLSRAVADAVHPHDRAMSGDITAMVAGDPDRGPAEYRIILPDTSVRWIHSESTQELDVDGNVIALVGYARDVTTERAVREELRDTEQAFRATFERSAVGMAHVGIDGRWLRVNRRLCSMLGYSREELMGLTFGEVTHPDDLADSLEHVRLMLDGKEETYDVEKRYIRKDGGVVWVNLNAAVVRDEAGRPCYFVTVLEDITQERVAQAAQALSEAKFETAFHTSPDAVNINRLSDGLYLEVNQGFADLTGYTAEDVEGKTSADIAIWENPEDRARLVRGLQADGEVQNLEARFRRKDGSVTTAIMSARVIEVGGEPCILSVTHDIAERKATEDALRASETMYRTIAEKISDVVWILDPETQRFLYVSPSVERLRGFTATETMAEPLEATLTPEGREVAHDLIAQAVADFLSGKEPPGRQYAVEIEQTRKEGSAVWTEVVATLQMNADTGRLEVHGVTRDASERKRAEKYNALSREVLQILNERSGMRESITGVIEAIKTKTGIDAVGVRLLEGRDFPYFAAQGFPEGFLEAENSLVDRGPEGWVFLREDGDVDLACTCGLVLGGKGAPFVTPGGSFWINDSLPLLDLAASDDPRARPRNRCIHEGYASMALVPIRDTEKIVGLLHLNDHRPGFFDSQSIELLEGIAAHIGSALTRKQAQAELDDRERWLSESQRIAHLGHYIYDIEKDWWDGSPSLYDVLGVEESHRRDFAGWIAVVHPDDQDRLAHYFTDHVIGEHALFDIEYRIVRPRDGAERWVHGLGNVDYSEDGRPLAMFGIIQDITERKLAEEQLGRSLESIIEVVSNVVELRDPYTAGHQRRVSELGAAIAREMGMDESQIEEIRISGLIHDVGKMSVPAEILSKPGKLLPMEFELIKQHAESGYRIIAAANMRGNTAEIVHQHHERCDGSGYPRGLSGDEILLSAKVLMVADVIEAMMSHRPYRAALGWEAAVAEIRDGLDTKYDAGVSRAAEAVFLERGFEFSEG